MFASDPPASPRRGWLPTFLIVFALVFMLVWGLRGLLNVVGASPSLQSGLFQVFRVLAAIGDGVVLLGGLTLAVRPGWLLSTPRVRPHWRLRLAGVAIVLVGGLGTATFWLSYNIGVANPPPLVLLAESLVTMGPLLPIPAYLLLLGLVLRGAGGPSAGQAHGG